MSVTVPFYRHSLDVSQADSVKSVLESTFLTTGPVCRRVEDALKTFFDTPFARLTSSWTSGAIATLLALDIRPNDEVIVPAMSFVATANVVRLVGATPVFVDVDPSTLLMDLAAVRRAMTQRTKAIIPVHLYGQMVDISALREVVGAGVWIIEDAAHCFEGSRHGRRPGQISDVAIFSFYATKNVTCGEGGAVISRNEDFGAKLLQTSLHGMSAGADRRFDGQQYRHWDVARLGTKANLPDLLAAYLEPQISTVELLLEQREILASYYEKVLKESVFTFPYIEPGVVSARHLFPIGVPTGKRDLVLQRLGEFGIGATVNYRSITELSLYRDAPEATTSVPVATKWGDCTLSLPLYPRLSRDEQTYVLDVLLNSIQPLLVSKENSTERDNYVEPRRSDRGRGVHRNGSNRTIA